jgi:hypothetical protein
MLNALFVRLATMVKFTAVKIVQEPHEKSPVMKVKNDTNKPQKAN